MAINPLLQYPGKIAASTPDYPYGSAQNITVPGDATGTPWEAALVNDFFGFQQALLKSNGLAPSGSPDKVSASQYLQSIIALASGRAIHYDETGVADAYVLDPRLDLQGPGAYFDGMIVKFTPTNDNTGPSTINVDGIGVKNIKKGSPVVVLTGGELITGVEIELRYNGVDFIKTVLADTNRVLLDHQSAAASAQINFIDQLDNAYWAYELGYYNVTTAEIADNLSLHLSDDSGVSWTANSVFGTNTNSQFLNGMATLFGVADSQECGYIYDSSISGIAPSRNSANIPGGVITPDSLQVKYLTGAIDTGEFFLYGINPR